MKPRRLVRPRPKWMLELNKVERAEVAEIRKRLEAIRRVQVPLIKRLKRIMSRHVKKPKPVAPAQARLF